MRDNGVTQVRCVVDNGRCGGEYNGLARILRRVHRHHIQCVVHFLYNIPLAVTTSNKNYGRIDRYGKNHRIHNIPIIEVDHRLVRWVDQTAHVVRRE